MKKYFIIYIVTAIFLFSCGADPASPEDGGFVDQSQMAGFGFEMDDGLALTISARNFSETISVMSFTLAYNNLTISNIEGGEFSKVFDSKLEGVEDDHPSFTFADVTGTGTLLKVQLENASEGAIIFITNEIFFNNSIPKQLKTFDTFRNIGLCYTNDLSTRNEDIILDEPMWNQGINYCMD